ncbi:MAG: hypothetical protein U9P50_02090 [Patescibacteria group bacterium]|nr:hypothetical protein [Patescibacteria group bacterium]
MRTATLKMNNVNKKSIFWALTGVLVLLVGLYFCFITQTIINTASYQSIERKITALDSEISGLESQYISLKREVDYDLAKELGYIEVATIKFIDKGVINQTLSLVK